MKTVFILNSKKKRIGRLLPELERLCRERGLNDVQFLATMRKKHAVDLARQATKDSCDYLIAVGGDGTLHEVVNGVFQSRLPVNLYPVIGLLPYGSANDFAKTAGIPAAASELLDLIASKSIQRTDLGKMSFQETGETRHFINIAGVGLGAEVVRNMAHSSGFPGPGFHYFKSILAGFLRYEKIEVSCRGDRWEWSGRLLQLAVGNGRYFGNGICIAPDANITDGRFQVSIFGDLSIWDYLKNLSKLKKGVKINHAEVHYHLAREVLIESSGACGVEADGEYIGLAPVSISVLPKALRFLLPAARP